MGKIGSDGRSNHRLTPSHTRVVHGEDDLSSWDDEELLRGVRRNKFGKFPKTPAVIPRQIHEEYQKRRLVKALGLLRDSAVDAVTALREIVNDKDANPQTRITAAQAILSRTIPEKSVLDIELGARPAFVGIIQAGLVVGGTPLNRDDDAPALGSGDIIDAEVIEWEDDDPIIDPIEPVRPVHVPNRPAREYLRPQHGENRARISR